MIKLKRESFDVSLYAGKQHVRRAVAGYTYNNTFGIDNTTRESLPAFASGIKSRYWKVTHMPSGRAITFGFDTLKQARLFVALICNATDWQLSNGNAITALRPDIKQVISSARIEALNL